MNQDAEHLRLLAIFHYVVAGLAALFSLFPLLVHDNRHDFHIRRATWHAKTRRGVAARISWLDFCRSRCPLVFTRDRDGDLYSDRRSVPFPPQGLFFRARDGLS